MSSVLPGSYQSAPLNQAITLASLLGEAAVEAAKQIHRLRLKQRNTPHRTTPKRHPGEDTPMWNAVSARLREELRPYGAKSRLARYLGVPPQRVTDFASGKRRLPDAETLLLILHWMSERAAGRDPSL